MPKLSIPPTLEQDAMHDKKVQVSPRTPLASRFVNRKETAMLASGRMMGPMIQREKPLPGQEQ